VSRHGTPIQLLHLRRHVDVGIVIDSQDGIVPEYEDREACVFSNYNWTNWLELTGMERAYAVAHYRMHHTIEAHINDAYDKAGKRATPNK